MDPEDYVQRYNSRGYPYNPESRAQSRRLRRAQNDVLATVGVCVERDEDTLSTVANGGNDRKKVERVVTENEVGLGIAAGELGLAFLSLWGVSAFRGRLQVL